MKLQSKMISINKTFPKPTQRLKIYKNISMKIPLK